eukprot:365533-Chlamydomonas_euryale.AAC.15
MGTHMWKVRAERGQVVVQRPEFDVEVSQPSHAGRHLQQARERAALQVNQRQARVRGPLRQLPRVEHQAHAQTRQQPYGAGIQCGAEHTGKH